MHMKVSRKLQVHFEAKIRHAIATGPLPYIERGSTRETEPKQESDKDNGTDADQSK